MIYVTHDQTEALTIADQVVVMHEGTVVQIGTPVELFERPAHTFVGHFIGSPGMNVLPCEVRGGAAFFQGVRVPTESVATPPADAGRLEIGVRPEFVSLAKAGAESGVPVDIVRIADVGRYRVLEARAAEERINFLMREGEAAATGPAHLTFDPAKTRVYADGWLVGGAT